ncbi:MAG: DUF192 domain-containing protein [Candidatus Omnitrophica bacterium]|nr:DUF192 domain-containing protein [Candidatus Omnitrophota bacterium]
MKIFNKTRGTIIAAYGDMADTPLSRMTGLLNRTSLAKDSGLVITACQSIHMFFMKFAIDAIFVDKNNVVVGLVHNIKPFQLSPIFFKASYVIEVPVQTIAQTKTAVGDEIDLNH